MSLRKPIIMILGIAAITVLFIGAYIARPVWMKFNTAMNSTVYSQNVSEGITQWGKIENTVNAGFWLFPAVAAIIIVIGVYMVMQEKEYLRERGAFR